MPWEHQLITIYLTIDRYFKEDIFYSVERFSNNNVPKFSDEEIISIYIWGVISGHTTLKKIYSFTSNHLSDWFPNLPKYESFVRRLNRLSDSFIPIIEKLQNETTEPVFESMILDSMPIVLAKEKRSKSAKIAHEIADKGYCATKNMYYYGIKLHVIGTSVPNALPVPTHIGITGASMHDLTAARDVFDTFDSSEIFGDKAYCDKTLKEDMLELQNIEMHTPIKTSRSKKTLDLFERLYSASVSKIRQPIESFFSWLQEKTKIQCASKVRSNNGLTVHVFGKIAAAFFMLAF